MHFELSYFSVVVKKVSIVEGLFIAADEDMNEIPTGFLSKDFKFELKRRYDNMG